MLVIASSVVDRLVLMKRDSKRKSREDSYALELKPTANGRLANGKEKLDKAEVVAHENGGYVNEEEKIHIPSEDLEGGGCKIWFVLTIFYSHYLDRSYNKIS